MDVIIVGDGPGGLSAALLLAKNGLDVVVYGQDKTAMHYALLRNYLGLPEIHGSEFQKIARDQVQSFGAKVEDQRVESIEKTNQGFVVKLENGTTHPTANIILSEGKSPRLAKQLGLEHNESSGIQTDDNGLTGVPGLYVVGRLRRPGRSQAIISAGDGAAAAIDLLSKRKGENFADWDSPPES